MIVAKTLSPSRYCCDAPMKPPIPTIAVRAAVSAAGTSGTSICSEPVRMIFVPSGRRRCSPRRRRSRSVRQLVVRPVRPVLAMRPAGPRHCLPRWFRPPVRPHVPAAPQAATRTAVIAAAAINPPRAAPRVASLHVLVLHCRSVPNRPAAASPRRGFGCAGSSRVPGYTRRDAPAPRAAPRAHARETVERPPRRRGLALRAEVGRLPGDRLPRRR